MSGLFVILLIIFPFSYGFDDLKPRLRNSLKSVSSTRSKRSLPQLAVLVEDFTQYNAADMIDHGNWCGLGGDRARDGSFTDQCDLCCKLHDRCYEALLKRWIPGSGRCVPYTRMYGIDLDGGNPSCSNMDSPCSLNTCLCDVQFVHCLRRARGCWIVD